MSYEHERLGELIKGVKKSAKIPKGFQLWSMSMQMAWLRQNQRRKTKAEVAGKQRELLQGAFERAQCEGAKRHTRYWLTCNDAAVDIMRHFGFDPADLKSKALVSVVILKVLDKVKRLEKL